MPLTSNAPNGMYNEWNYEGYGSLQRLLTVSNKASASSGVLSRFYYGYNTPATATSTDSLDARNGVGKQYGNIVAEKQNVAYSYNATSMLTQESGTAGNTQTPNLGKTYGYDAMGNRTLYKDFYANQFEAASTYNTLNQITQTSNNKNTVTSYSHDGDGNMTAAFSSLSGVTNSRVSYTYDEESRLTSISQLNGLGQTLSKYEFVYDGMSRLRISRYYARDLNNILTLQNETRRVYDGIGCPLGGWFKNATSSTT